VLALLVPSLLSGGGGGPSHLTAPTTAPRFLSNLLRCARAWWWGVWTNTS